MAEQSSTASTDVRVLRNALLTVVMILLIGYGTVSMMGAEQLGANTDIDEAPTLVAYQPADDGSTGEDADERTQVAQVENVTDGQSNGETDGALDTEDADDIGTEPAAQETVQSDDTAQSSATAQADASQAMDAGATDAIGSPTAEPESQQTDTSSSPPPSVAERLTAIAQGTPLSDTSAADSSSTGTTTATATIINPETGPIATATPILSLGTASAATNEVTTVLPEDSPVPTATPTLDAGLAAANEGSDGSGNGGVSGAMNSGFDSASLASLDKLFGVTRGTGATLYDLPEGLEVTTLPAGAAVSGFARSEDGQWVLLQGANTTGWAPLNELVMYGSENLPLLSELELSTTVPNIESESGADLSANLSETAEPVADQGNSESGGSMADSTASDLEIPIVAQVATGLNRLNARSGPGTNYGIVDRLQPSSEHIALARDGSGGWIQLSLPDIDEGSGWVSADFVELSGELDRLPVSEEFGGFDVLSLLPTPTPNAAQTETSSSAPLVAIPTPTALAPVAVGPAESNEPAQASTQADTGAPEEGSEVNEQLLTLYTGPGTEYEIVKEVGATVETIELERSEDGLWVRVAILEPPGGVGWIPAEPLEASSGASPPLAPQGTAAPATTPTTPSTPVTTQAISDPTQNSEITEQQEQVTDSNSELGDTSAQQPIVTPTTAPITTPNATLATTPDIVLAITPIPTPNVASEVVSGTEPLYVHAAPDIGSEIVGMLDIDSSLEPIVESEDGAWLQIALPPTGSSPDERTGWIAAMDVESSAARQADDENSIVDVASAEDDATDATVTPSVDSSESVKKGAGSEVKASKDSGTATVAPKTENGDDVASPVPSTAVDNQKTDESPIATTTATTATVVSEYAFLNVRTGPGTEYDVIGQIKPGETLNVLGWDAAEKWAQIKVPEPLTDGQNEIGWVAGTFIELSETVLPIPAGDAGDVNTATDNSVVDETTDKDSDATQDAAPVAEILDTLEPPKYLPVVGEPKE